MKIIGWVVVGLAILFAGGLGYLRYGLPSVGPAADIAIERTPERIERGRYLVENVMACMSCHSPARHGDRYSLPPIEEKKGAGGLYLGTQHDFPGALNSKNITPHNLGTWTDGEIVRALTVGVTREGEPIFPIMPYTGYGTLDREDIYAAVAYLRTLAPVANAVPDSEIDFPLDLIIRTDPKETTFGKRPDPSDSVALGRYMATAAGCVDCHTKPVWQSGGGEPFAGGLEFYFPPTGLFRTANITPDIETGIGYWTREAFIDRFKSMDLETVMDMKVEPGEANTIMPWWAFSGMKRADLGAIYDYLMTLEPVRSEVITFEPIGE